NLWTRSLQRMNRKIPSCTGNYNKRTTSYEHEPCWLGSVGWDTTEQRAGSTNTRYHSSGLVIYRPISWQAYCLSCCVSAWCRVDSCLTDIGWRRCRRHRCGVYVNVVVRLALLIAGVALLEAALDVVSRWQSASLGE